MVKQGQTCNNTMSEHELSFRYNQIIKDLLNVIGKVTGLLQKIIEEHSTKQRYMLWEKQGGKCTITGKLI